MRDRQGAGRRRSWLCAPLVATAVLSAVAMGCDGDDEPGRETKDAPAEGAAAVEDECVDLPGGVGTCTKPDGQRLVIVKRRSQLRLEDVAVRVQEVENRQSLVESGPQVTARGTLVIFTLSVRNLGSRPLDWSGALPRRAALLMGDQAFRLQRHGRRGFLETAPGTSAEPIPPGVSAPKRLVFDLPAQAAERVLEEGSTLEVISTKELTAGRSTSSAGTVGRIKLG